MKTKIFITAFLLLLLAGNGMAQCRFTVSANTKNVTCGNDGAVQAVISYPSGSSASDFVGFTYHLKQGGTAINSTSNIDPYIGGLAAGTYELVVTGKCISTSLNVEETVGNITISAASGSINPFTVNYVSKGTPSLPDYGTGQLKFRISGTGISDKFTLTIDQHPASYTGPTQFIVGKGDITIDKLTYAASSSEYYKFTISDGCNNPVTLGTYNVDVLESNFPPASAMRLSLMGMPYVEARYTYWPSENRSSVYYSRTAYLYGTDTYQVGWYEIGYSYTNDPATAEWEVLKANSSDTLNDDEIPICPGYTYKDYITNGSSSTLGVPYTWLRLKDYPDVTFAYQGTTRVVDAMNGLTFHQYKDYGEISLDFLDTSPQHWLYSPITFKAVSRDDGTVYSVTYTDQHEVLSLKIPWKSPYLTTRNFDLIAVMGEGSEQITYNLGYFDISPGISTANTLYDHFGRTACIDWGYYSIYTSKTLIGRTTATAGITRSINYDITGWTFTTASTQFSHQTIKLDESQNSNSSIYLTSTDEYGKDSSLKDIPSGTYTWQVVASPLDAASFGQEIKTGTASKTITKPDNPVVKTPYREKLTSLKRVSQTCQDVTFSFDRDELWSRFKESDGVTPLDGLQAQIILVYYNGTGWYQISSNTHSFANGSSSISLYWASPTVELTVKNDFPITVNGNQYDVYLAVTLGVPYEKSIYFPSASQVIGVDGACYWLDTDPILVNLTELTRVIIDEDRTGGYRCTSTGSATVEVAMSYASDYKLSLFREGETTAVQTKTITNSDICIFSGLPADINNYTVTVENVSATGIECAVEKTTRDIYIQTLDNPRLASYEGGMSCISETGSNLVLKAISIIRTSYRWYDPDGIAVTYAGSGAVTSGGAQVGATASSDYNVIEIPFANIKAGQYTCVVTMESGTGCSPVSAKTPYVSLDGGVPLYWSINAADADWNNDANWNDALGQAAFRIPNKCTDVYIPSKVNTVFPDLDPTVTIGDALCRDINFQYGARVAFTNKLNYDRAFIEYNFGYYGDGVTPNEGDLPTVNAYNGTTPYGTVTGAPSLSRNRWWMLASPLKDMYTGDFELMGKPFTARASTLYKDTSDTYIQYTSNKNFTVFGENNVPLSDIYNGFLLWVPSYNKLTGGGQDILQNSNIKGVLRYPYFDDENIKNAREITHSGTATTFKVYDFINPGTTVASNKVDRTYYDSSKNIYMANRFIYEQANGTVATNSTGEPVYKIQINADPNRATAYGWNFIMIANPFMAPIDFKKFYEANSSIIDKYCYIYNPEKPGSWDVIWNTSAISIIAPQQSFGVGFLYPNEASSAELVFNLNDVIVADNSIQPRLSAVELSKQQYQPVERGRIIRQHEVLTVFHATGKDLENVNAVNFVYASWEDNNPGTEESARQFEISPDTDSSQQIITYGTSPIIKYPISVTTGADNTTLVFEHTSSSVKSMNLTNKSSGETFNLFEHKNKNGLISLTVECRPNDNNLFELEITRN